jgi:hypothetical protein
MGIRHHEQGVSLPGKWIFSYIGQGVTPGYITVAAENTDRL